MPLPSSRWLWHALTALILAALAAGIYGASRRIDYSWHWDRIPQYLVSHEGEDVKAPFDGFVALGDDGRSMTMTALKGADSASFDGIVTAAVGNGDLVFQGDLLGKKAGELGAGTLLTGLWLTLEISALSLLFALPLGVLAGLGRVSGNPTARSLSALYVELIRGTPLLVQIFIMYFFIGTVLKLSAFAAGTAALAIFTGAYVAEIVRAGIQAVPKGQTEAALSVGLSNLQTMRHVILPQATRRVLPPLAGQFINLIKDSSLVSVMALTDLTKAGREVVSSTFLPFEVWFTVAAMYLLLTGALSLAVRRLERHFAARD
ncbi:MAG: amino acid ABC transporter permease [Nevskia sp.]